MNNGACLRNRLLEWSVAQAGFMIASKNIQTI